MISCRDIGDWGLGNTETQDQTKALGSEEVGNAPAAEALGANAIGQ